ncbi:hypothetical protein [Dehalobacter sp.]|uniref:hypothetical protein n=1 Tax=Dehalobacter sp. TaxID=1962289 RepID=UPI002589B9DB|nr:hypothetical protein [Dehalobacter sp.]MDJ0306211.1 hypothetical protein [Dehalobacter sp.]
MGVFPYLMPVWHTDWRDEALSWHLTCSLHAGLNPSVVTILRGPEAKKFMSENFVNNVEDFPIGIIKHGILCLENGLIATHGVIMRTGEEEYELWWHAPYLNYLFGLKDYNAELIDMTMKVFILQLQGPNCLSILEEATGEDLKDIDYRHYRNSTINGHKVRILRFGMAGTLSYEVHGEAQYSKEIQKKLIEIGNPYGIRQLGFSNYLLNHSEGGNFQANLSFMSALFLDEGFQKWSKQGSDEGEGEGEGELNYSSFGFDFKGSAGGDPMKVVFNPIECGLGKCINWNHDFRGKAALLEYKKNQKRDIVTLEWNAEDIIDVYASNFRPGEENYSPMDFPGPESMLNGSANWVLSTDYVYNKDGKEIGLSTSRTQSHYYRTVISMALLDLEYRDFGTEVYVLWGEVGSRQKKIRAKVSYYPYNRDNKDRTGDQVDVRSLSSR